MKLPNGIRVQGSADGVPDVNRLIEAIVRDCAKEALNEVGIRQRTPREIANDILARYRLEPK